MMSHIRAKNTGLEMILRRGLHSRGFRYRLHIKQLPGCPDLVFSGRRSVIFANGCFWHGHDCPLFRYPASREEFWRTKIEANRARDRAVQSRLLYDGWRILTVWECAVRGNNRMGVDKVLNMAAEWLESDTMAWEIAGENCGYL